MATLNRYIISILLAVITVFGFTAEADLSAAESWDNTLSAELETLYIESSTSHSDLELPRQTYGSGTNILRLQSTSNRTYNTHRGSAEFIRAGKIISTSIKNDIQKTTLNIQYLIVKPVYRLIRLGKLII